MEKFKELAEKYNILIKKTLKDNKEILIDSFVEYYGESYGSLIETRYNEITYAWYINWFWMAIASVFLNESDNERILQDIDAFKKNRSIWKKLNKFSTSLVGLSDDDILQESKIKYYLFKYIKKHKTCNFNCCNDKYYRVIVFPLFMANECSVIHEINHAITSDIMAEYKNSYIIEKNGINVYPNNKSKILDELLNEKSSIIIAEIFKRKGGNLSSFCINTDLYYIYKNNLYLINEFFDNFKELIDKARISSNQIELLNRIGREEFFEYASLVSNYYSCYADLKDARIITKETLCLDKILNKMKINSVSSKDLTEEDLNAYYRLLEEQGKKVTILNKLDTPKL